MSSWCVLPILGHSGAADHTFLTIMQTVILVKIAPCDFLVESPRNISFVVTLKV